MNYFNSDPLTSSLLVRKLSRYIGTQASVFSIACIKTKFYPKYSWFKCDVYLRKQKAGNRPRCLQKAAPNIQGKTTHHFVVEHPKFTTILSM